MQILTIIVLYNEIFSNTIIKSCIYLKWESPRLMWEEKGRKKIRSFRKEMATKNKSIKECREFGGRKQNLLKDISTESSIIRVWKRTSSVRGVRGWGGEQSVPGRDAEVCSKSKENKLRGKGLSVRGGWKAPAARTDLVWLSGKGWHVSFKPLSFNKSPPQKRAFPVLP